jgi:hypothetical protein
VSDCGLPKPLSMAVHELYVCGLEDLPGSAVEPRIMEAPQTSYDYGVG